jgi:hypothetical protein
LKPERGEGKFWGGLRSDATFKWVGGNRNFPVLTVHRQCPFVLLEEVSQRDGVKLREVERVKNLGAELVISRGMKFNRVFAASDRNCTSK